MTMRSSEVVLYVDPMSPHFEGNRLFEPYSSGGIDPLLPYAYLRDWCRERGLEVHTADLLDAERRTNGRLNIYVSFGIRDRYRKLVDRGDVVPAAFFAIECPVVEPRLYRDLTKLGTVFNRVFSYSTESALAPFLTGPVQLHHFLYPQSHDDVFEDVWRRRDRKFLAMINANKLPRVYVNELYTERLRAIRFFNQRGEIDLYGVGWDEPPYQLGETWVPASIRRIGRKIDEFAYRAKGPRDPLRRAALAAYRGSADSKLDVLGGYTFAICFENSILQGWITEKIFDCFYAGTIPVYLGAPDIDRWIPRECFVDFRDFEGYDALRERLHSMSGQEIDAYRDAARDYLRSERFHPFSKEAFAEAIGAVVEADTGLSLR
jgi:alpha(1,3/1,4) fucosyltransferase